MRRAKAVLLSYLHGVVPLDLVGGVAVAPSLGAKQLSPGYATLMK
jgi:hypothetical protein